MVMFVIELLFEGMIIRLNQKGIRDSSLQFSYQSQSGQELGM